MIIIVYVKYFVGTCVSRFLLLHFLSQPFNSTFFYEQLVSVYVN